MKRALCVILASLALGCMGWALADPQPKDGETVRVIRSYPIQEKLAGREAAATIVEVSIEPGEAGLPHRHPGPAFVYVLEGEYELGIDDQPTKIFRAGEVFYEPTGCLHRVSKNPASKGKTRLIATVLHPRETMEIATPESLCGKPE